MKIFDDNGKEISLGQLLKKFNDYPSKQKNALRAAVRAAAVVVQKEAQTLAPMQTDISAVLKKLKYARPGSLRKSIKVRARRSKDPSITKFSVSTDLFYGKFIEFGTKPHKIKTKNKKFLAGFGTKVEHPGFSQKPFMRPAVDNKEHLVISTMANTLKKRLEKF